MEIVTIKTFNNYFSANVYLGRLQSAGLECYLQDENTITLDPLLTNAIGGIKIVVKKENLDRALALVKEFDEESLRSAKCPRCGQAAFEYIPKRKAQNRITSILAWLFSGTAGNEDHVYHCQNCGYETESLPDQPSE